MAIFRAETKSLSRGQGHNLAAAISYRAGIELTDNNKLNPEARSYDYTKKTDVVHSGIILPNQLSEQLEARGIELDFQSIADLVEMGETTLRGKMKNSARLAREWVLCGVPELSRAENIELFEQFAKQQSEEQGVLGMVFVHDPTAGDDMATTKAAANKKKMSAPDPRNIHAHILLLTREINVSAKNKLSLGRKSDSEVSNDERTRPVVPKELIGKVDPKTQKKIQQGRGLCSNSEWLKNTRKQWADILNERLAQKGVQPVTHKSYKDLGLNFKPTKHLGKNASIAERMGVQTYLGKHNESINRHNRSHLKSTAGDLADSAKQGIERSKRRISDSGQNIEWTDAETSWAAGSIRELNRRVADSKQCIEDGKQCIENRKRDVTWAVRANEELNKVHSFNSTNIKWAVRGTERFHKTINSTEQQTASTVEQERRVNRLITERTGANSSAKPNPFDDAARRARATRISEQEGRFDRRTEQFDRDIARNRSADARTAEAAGRLKLNMAMVLLNRHHENSALQHWETTEDSPDKFDTRQLNLLDNFAQTIGVDDKIINFINDSRRVAEFFTVDVIEQNIEIFKLLRNPVDERELHVNSNDETSKSAPQSDLNQSTRDSIGDTPKTLNRADLSVSIASRRRRP